MNLWQDKLAFSQTKIDSDIAIIKSYFPHCIDVKKSDITADKTGVDYVATLIRGAEILIDAKTREKGASQFWKNGEPELALELYSVVEDKKTGWSLNTASPVDYVLYTFSPEDTTNSYMIPFQQLRKVLIEKFAEWQKQYDCKTQESDNWHSQAIFVPVGIVLQAINQACIVL